MGVVSIIGGIISLLNGGVGGDVPGGSDTQIQFNDGGAFGGDDQFIWNKTTNVLGIGPPLTPAQITVTGTVIFIDAPAGASPSGNGAQLSLRAGVPVDGDGDGGNAILQARNGVGTNRAGGDTQIIPGNPTGSGTQGTCLLGGQVAVAESVSAPAIGTGGTVTTAAIYSSRLAPAGAVMGVIMQAGTRAGQKCTVINQSAAINTITMAVAATSNVANGVGTVIAGLTAKSFTWNSITSLWYPEN